MPAFDPANVSPVLKLEYPLARIEQGDQNVGYPIITVHEGAVHFQGYRKMYNPGTGSWTTGDTFTLLPDRESEGTVDQGCMNRAGHCNPAFIYVFIYPGNRPVIGKWWPYIFLNRPGKCETIQVMSCTIPDGHFIFPHSCQEALARRPGWNRGLESPGIDLPGFIIRMYAGVTSRKNRAGDIS